MPPSPLGSPGSARCGSGSGERIALSEATSFTMSAVAKKQAIISISTCLKPTLDLHIRYITILSKENRMNIPVGQMTNSGKPGAISLSWDCLASNPDSIPVPSGSKLNSKIDWRPSGITCLRVCQIISRVQTPAIIPHQVRCRQLRTGSFCLR